MQLNFVPTFSNIQKPSFGNTPNTVTLYPASIQDKFESELQKEKNKVIKILKKIDTLKPKCLEFIKDAYDQDDLQCQIGVVANIVTENLLNENLQDKTINWPKILQTKKLPFEAEKLIYKTTTRNNKKLIQLYKALCEKDTNPRVKNIKAQLQNMGVKSVYLDNNLEEAIRCFQAIKLLKKQNFPLPKEIIINKHFPCGGVALQPTQTIILKPYDECDLFAGSTNSDKHKIIHECVHLTQPNLVAFNIKSIPSEYNETINNLSDYAENNFAHEIHAELVTKKLIDGLTKEEENLLKYIES